MIANYSSAARTYEYQPTILDTKPLLTRLAVQSSLREANSVAIHAASLPNWPAI